jgi:imidazole glycerol-phosphate synthase subunit HisH
MLSRVGVVDYGSGNLRSVCNALETAGSRPRLVTGPSEIDGLDALVVPGVGAFGHCAASLARSGLRAPVRDWIAAGRPFLGICLGYQLLFESSEESPGVAGLGIFPGVVRRFPVEAGLKVPHMGWNTLHGLRGPLFQGFSDGVSMYFVHSYHPVPADPSLAASLCSHGVEFAASISVGAVHATQFHPEKSQQAGLALLRNFLNQQ